jgi:hypothetical protein
MCTFYRTGDLRQELYLGLPPSRAPPGRRWVAPDQQGAVRSLAGRRSVMAHEQGTMKGRDMTHQRPGAWSLICAGRVAGDRTASGDRAGESGQAAVWAACEREASNRRRACGRLGARRCSGRPDGRAALVRDD